MGLLAQLVSPVMANLLNVFKKTIFVSWLSGPCRYLTTDSDRLGMSESMRTSDNCFLEPDQADVIVVYVLEALN